MKQWMRVIALGLAIVVGITLTATFPMKVSAAEQAFTVKVYNAAAQSVSIKWTKQQNVKFYKIYRSTSKKKGYKKIKTTTKCKFTNKSLNEKKTYYYKVKATATDGTKYTSNIVTKVKVKGKYNRTSPFGVKMTAKQQKQVKNATAKFVNTKIKQGWPKWKKALVAYYYVQDNCKTLSWASGEGTSVADTAWGSLVDGEAWCSGYAMGYQTLCDAMGVKCSVKKKKETSSHVWNVVRIGGKSYKMDTQGGIETITERVAEAKAEVKKGQIKDAQAVYSDGVVQLSWEAAAYPDMEYKIYRFTGTEPAAGGWGELSIYKYAATTTKNSYRDKKPKFYEMYNGYFYKIEAYKDGLKTCVTYASCNLE